MAISPEDLDATVTDLIAAAIDTRHRLSFTYRDLPRIVNPLRIGRSEDGEWMLRAVQVGGESASNQFGGRTPKLFLVDDMSEVAVLPGEFEIPRRADPDDVIVDILAELRPLRRVPAATPDPLPQQRRAEADQDAHDH